MTLPMPDSIRPEDLPPGYAQYLVYTDGAYPTEFAVAKRFPHARLVSLTVTGATFAADGIDIEPGNPTAKDGAQWARQKLNRQPASRPVLYASIIGEPGYGMGDVRDALAANGIARSQVRLLSAHYGEGEHICGPGTCGASVIDMDGTQWTDEFWPDGHPPTVDMSALMDGFFGSWTEEIVQQLPVVQQGDSGEPVKTVQGLVNARGGAGHVPVPLVIDGVFGWKTQGAVEILQADAKIAQDGVVGPQTWPVLLGIA